MFIDQSFLSILSFQRNAKTDDVGKYLKSSIKQDTWLRMRIYSGFRQVKRIEQDRILIMSIIDELLRNEKKLARLEVQRKMLDSIEGVKDKFWHNLLLLHLSLFSKNPFWYKELSQSILRMGPYVSLFSGLGVKEFNNQLVVNFIIKTLMFYENKDDGENYKYLANRLSSYGGDKLEYKEIAKRFNASWSLNELRETFLNPRLQFQYFDFLIERMLNRTNELEVRSHIQKVIRTPIIRSCSSSQLWLLKYYYPSQEEMRKLIVDKMGQTWVYGTLVEKYQVLQLLNNKTFKNGLRRRYSEFKRPNFKIKRDFYQSLLFSGQASTFAFYRLYQLGDRSPEYLWWLIF